MEDEGTAANGNSVYSIFNTSKSLLATGITGLSQATGVAAIGSAVASRVYGVQTGGLVEQSNHPELRIPHSGYPSPQT